MGQDIRGWNCEVSSCVGFLHLHGELSASIASSSCISASSSELNDSSLEKYGQDVTWFDISLCKDICF